MYGNKGYGDRGYGNKGYGDRGGGGGFTRSFAPVKVGDEVDVKIEAVGEKGDGIAKIKGFVIFVPGAKKDEEVKVKITKVLRKVGFGEIVGSSSGSSSEESSETEESEESSEASEEESSESTEDSEEF